MISVEESMARIGICRQCREKCAGWRAKKIAVIYDDCALGRFAPATDALVRSTATDHEQEAARAGYVPSCCGSAANRNLLS